MNEIILRTLCSSNQRESKRIENIMRWTTTQTERETEGVGSIVEW